MNDLSDVVSRLTQCAVHHETCAARCREAIAYLTLPTPTPVIDARQRFRLGQRVRLTEAGRKHYMSPRRMAQPLRKWKPTGHVVGFSRRGDSVAVVPDGVYTRRSYGASFWEPIPEATSPLTTSPQSATIPS